MYLCNSFVFIPQRIRCLLLQLTIVFVLSACDKNDPDIIAGETVFNQTCKVCHASGINGAPIVGNQKMWQARAARGIDTLVEHATQGFGLMPAKGGNEALSDAEIRQAVKYFLSKLAQSE